MSLIRPSIAPSAAAYKSEKDHIVTPTVDYSSIRGKVSVNTKKQVN